MAFVAFNPFGKDIRDVQTADLHGLRTVNEGWYVEYKAALPKPERIAKSIAALANTHGGWLWFGISAPSNSAGCAESFPGIPTEDIPESLRRITDAVGAHLNPHPHFEPAVFKGPEVSLALGPNRSIIAVAVPEGRNAPFVHSSGVIYVRVGDSSSPVAETDRSRVRALFSRSERARERVNSFLDQRSERFSSVPHAQFFLVPDLYDERRWRHNVTFAEFAAIMRGTESRPTADGLFSLPYSEAQAVHNGYLARQRQQRPGVPDVTLSFRFTRAGAIVVSVPFSTATTANRRELRRYLSGYDHAGKFADLCATYGQLRVLDLGFLYVILTDTIVKARSLRKLCQFANDDGTMSLFGRIYNVQGLAPFVDTKFFIEHCEGFGVPFVADQAVSFPGENLPDGILCGALDDDREGSTAFLDALLPCLLTTQALGIPVPDELLVPETEFDKTRELVVEWLTLTSRAARAQDNRNKATSPDA